MVAKPISNPLSFSPSLHVVVSPSKLISLAGGSWTTMRPLVEEAVDIAIKENSISCKIPSSSSYPPLIGSEQDIYSTMEILQSHFNLDEDIACHLAHNYGNRSLEIAHICEQGFGQRLSQKFPYVEAEVIYSVRFEYTQTPLDFILRRIPLGIIDKNSSQVALPRIVELMGEEFKWTESKQQKELIFAKKELSINR